jgi:hypothetical protein
MEVPSTMSSGLAVGRAGQPPDRLLWAAAACALLYGTYRAYYALGGTVGMFGTPVSMSSWHAINGVAAAMLLVAAIIPLATRRLWTRSPWRAFLLAGAWVVAVGCVMHALIGIITRVLSLAGVLIIDYPFFSTIDRTAADLQALFFNEPWFLVEGVLWGAIGWTALRSDTTRRRWILSAGGAIAVLTVIGVLSSLGVIGRLVIG